jgi:hypothetical protein
MSAMTCAAQSAKVAANSIDFKPDAEKKELVVGFRLVDAQEVTSVETTSALKEGALTTTWETWTEDKAPACAWLIVVDTSNPKRAKTISGCVDDVRNFLSMIPKQDSVSVCSLALNLVESVPFGSSAEDLEKGLVTIKADGDASKTTLIFTNLREGLSKLAERKEPRKALLLLTDGKDETPGGAEAREIEKNKLIEAANKAGIAVHTLGYAETAADQADFASLKEISSETDGIHRGASLASKELPDGIHGFLQGVMHGAGLAHIDLKSLKEPTSLTLTIKTADGKTATLPIPMEKVTAAAPAADAEPKDPSEEEKTKKEDEKKKADEKAAADKAVAEKAAAEAMKLEEAKKVENEKKKRLWTAVALGVFLLLLTVGLLVAKSARKRAEEQARLAEQQRLAEEARVEEETRLADLARSSDQTKKTEAPPLAWLEMCDAQQSRYAVRISNLKIGRGQHNDFVLRNDSISGNHCVLDCNRSGEWSITDLNSGNGVILNGELVKQAVLRHGDTIELGELKMRFLLRA